MDGQTTTTTVLVRGDAEGPATWALGSLFEQVASGADTGGAFGLSRVTQPAGTATPVHVHTREAEAFYLLDGTMAYRAGEADYQLSPGSFIYLPAGVPHAFRVTSTRPGEVPGHRRARWPHGPLRRGGLPGRTTRTARTRPGADAGRHRTLARGILALRHPGPRPTPARLTTSEASLSMSRHGLTG